ncbi:hypothetical protein HPB52_025342 [Rhipicephalus sanguineus]|uniref:Uncharacterized protein n=1 Tax=Rhipicephalus sanguineus TaxID=34632 RepID=A0A9D4PBB3_RHISA|nr:hypothetical protein HPB52_025342 [Rhipicephalus sanguineus]
MLVSVVVTEDLSVSVYFKCAPLVSDDVAFLTKSVIRVLDNLLDSVERYCEKKARQQEDKVEPEGNHGWRFDKGDPLCSPAKHVFID